MSAFATPRAGLVWMSAVALMLCAACNRPASAAIDPPIDRFEPAVRAFEAQDAAVAAARQAALAAGQKLTYPDRVVVAIGSSTFARWGTGLEAALSRPGTQVLNRGFGGSTIPEVTYYAQRLICKYRPDELLFYAGTNDIGEEHHNGRHVFADFQEFVRVVHACSPQTKIDFVSMSVAPSRVQYLADYVLGNELIRAFCAKYGYLHYVDVTKVMDTPDGMPKNELFDPADNLHMNAEGYALWLPILKSTLQGSVRKTHPRHRRHPHR